LDGQTADSSTIGPPAWSHIHLDDLKIRLQALNGRLDAVHRPKNPVTLLPPIPPLPAPHKRPLIMHKCVQDIKQISMGRQRTIDSSEKTWRYW
jgi:hypothetical protein